MDCHALHESALVVDSHNDTIVSHILSGRQSLAGEGRLCEQRFPGTIAFTRGEGWLGGDEYVPQINFPLMRRGGIDVGFFAIDVTRAVGNYLPYALDGLGYFFTDLEQSGAGAVVVRRVADLRLAQAQSRPAVVLALENADCTARSLNVLRSLYELGVRSIGLTHNVSSRAADGNAEARPGAGLSAFGVELVREMNGLGMLVDLAHVSEGAFYQALEVSSKPVIFSHGNARALCEHSRNLTDDQLKALAGKGGVIGLSFVPFFVDAENPTLDRFLDHVDHIRAVAGVAVMGIGSDFDGGGTLLPDATHMPRVTCGLLERGYDETEVRLILGGNTLRVLEASIG